MTLVLPSDFQRKRRARAFAGAVDAMLADGWIRNPLCDSGRMLFHPNDDAMVEISPIMWRDRTVSLDTIHVLPERRGLGHGSRALRRVLDVADFRGLRIEGTAVPFGESEGLTVDELEQWYERHGFTVRRSDGRFHRDPATP